MTFNSMTNSSLFNSYNINTGTDGKHFCYNQILKKLEDIMTYMTKRHCRVLFVRFDIRFPQEYNPTGGNNEISHLFKILKENSNNKGIDLRFLWVREQSREKQQHYHCVVLLNGNRVRDYRRFLAVVTKTWGYVIGCDPSGLVDWCDRGRNDLKTTNGIRIDRPQGNTIQEERALQMQAFNDTFSACFYWGSYLAKENQKANTPKGVRRYGASQT